MAVARRWLAWCAAVLVAAALSLAGAAGPAAAATLTSVTWTVSSSATGATGTSYSYAFGTATASSLSSVTMTVPAGTAGAPAVGTVRPASIAGGSVSLAAGIITYSFTATSVPAGTAISIRVTGLTNTGTPGSYPATVGTYNSGLVVDTGSSPGVSFTNATLISPSWTASAAVPGAAGVSYTYGFTIPAALTITSVTMSVPPGTAGTPTVGTVSPAGLLGGSVSLSGTTLTYSGVSVALLSGTTVSIQVTGLTNTTTPGSYTAQIVSYGLLGAPTGSGISPAVTIAGALTLTAPAALSFAGGLTGASMSLLSQQQFAVSDGTGSYAGWHITVSASAFSSGSQSLAASGTLSLNGSTSSASSAAAPAANCSGSCTAPSDLTAYPVAITAGAAPVTVYDSAAGTGSGSATLTPVSWWVTVPGSAMAGSYTSTVTVSIVSGP